MNSDYNSWLDGALAPCHDAWRPILKTIMTDLYSTNQSYLDELIRSEFFPTNHRIFAAFVVPPTEINYILFGEGPYPREDSATGFAFMDGAVKSIWIENREGFSKPVNRATSLRNFFKMLLRAENFVACNKYSGSMFSESLQAVPQRFNWIDSLVELQENLLSHGFLLLNTTLVYRSNVNPKKEAEFWLKFVNKILEQVDLLVKTHPALILWGKVAESIIKLPVSSKFNQVRSEHPYNLSFIENKDMWQIFRPLHLLEKKSC